MEKHGDTEKAVWINEYGWNAAPEYFDEEDLTWKRVTEEEQAEYTLQGIELARQEWPWAGVFNIWYFRQTGQQYAPDEAAYYFRMVDVDFTPRRVFDAVQDATSAIFVAPSGHFEETNPAVTMGEGWRSAMAEEASGQGLLVSDVPGASVTFTFRGNAVDLVARKGPQESHLLVTLDGRTIPGLPTDDQGRSYLDLQESATSWQVRLPIASGLTPDQHVVRLTVGDGGEAAVNVDAFEVNSGEPPAFPTLIVAGLGFGILAAAGALIWTLRSRPRREKFF
jgi:hypothetical protein